MARERVRISDVLSCTPEVAYDAWIDGALHAKMTGAKATSDPVVGGEYTAWDGYIVGRHVTLERPGPVQGAEGVRGRVVQWWRTTEFADEDPDSRLEVLFETDAEGTKITIVHSDLPPGTGGKYEEGWADHYIAPMQRYFGGHR